MKLKPIDLTKSLRLYKSGWVAINAKKCEVVAHAKTFMILADKVQGKKDIFLMPASKNYFGFVTGVDG